MKTEDLICSKLLEMMETTPLHQIKIAQLAEYCGISRSTFYTYFDSVFAAVQKIEDDLLDGVIDENSVDPSDKAAQVENLMFFRNNMKRLKILFGPNGDPSFIARLANRNRRVLKMLATKMNSKATTLELQIVNEFMQGGKMNVLRWWTENDKSVSVNDVLTISDKIMTSLHEILW